MDPNSSGVVAIVQGLKEARLSVTVAGGRQRGNGSGIRRSQQQPEVRMSRDQYLPTVSSGVQTCCRGRTERSPSAHIIRTTRYQTYGSEGSPSPAVSPTKPVSHSSDIRRLEDQLNELRASLYANLTSSIFPSIDPVCPPIDPVCPPIDPVCPTTDPVCPPIDPVCPPTAPNCASPPRASSPPEPCTRQPTTGRNRPGFRHKLHHLERSSSPSQDLRLADAFDESLRKYPNTADRNLSADVIQRLLSCIQTKNASKNPSHAKRVCSPSRRRDPLIHTKRSHKNIQTYTRSRNESPARDAKDINSKVERRRRVSPGKSGTGDRSPSNQRSASYDYLKIGSCSRPTDVMYLSDVARYVKDRLLKTQHDEVCPQMLDRYSVHKRHHQRNKTEASTTTVINEERDSLAQMFQKVILNWLEEIPEINTNEISSYTLAEKIADLCYSVVDEIQIKKNIIKEIKEHLEDTLEKKGTQIEPNEINRLANKLASELTDSATVNLHLIKDSQDSMIWEWINKIPLLTEATTMANKLKMVDNLSQLLQQIQNKSGEYEINTSEMEKEVNRWLDGELTKKAKILNANIRNNIVKNLVLNIQSACKTPTPKASSSYNETSLRYDSFKNGESLPLKNAIAPFILKQSDVYYVEESNQTTSGSGRQKVSKSKDASEYASREAGVGANEEAYFLSNAKTILNDFYNQHLDNPSRRKKNNLNQVTDDIVGNLEAIMNDSKTNTGKRKELIRNVLDKHLRRIPLDTDTPIADLTESLLEKIMGAYAKTSTPKNKGKEDSFPSFDSRTSTSGWKRRRSSEVNRYRNKIENLLETWLDGLSINEEVLNNPAFKDTVIKDLAEDIMDHEKYLQLNPNIHPTDAEELDSLKNLCQNWMKSFLTDDDLEIAGSKADELLEAIKDIPAPTLISEDERRAVETKAQGLPTYIDALQKEIMSWASNSPLHTKPTVENNLIKKYVADLSRNIQKHKGKPDSEEKLRDDIADFLPLVYGELDENELNRLESSLFEALFKKGFTDDTWVPNLTRDAKPTKPYKNAADILYEYIEEWIKNLPVHGDADEVKSVKQNLASKLINKIGALNMNPEIFNDTDLYQDILQDEVNRLLYDAPDNPELGKYLPALKKELISKVMDARLRMLEELAGKFYKQQLREKISSSLPLPGFMTQDEQISLELLKDKLADAFISLHYASCDETVRRKYKKKISEELDKFCGDILRHYSCARLDREALKSGLQKALEKVPVPRDDSMKCEVELVRIREIINDWMRELPLRQETPTEVLHRHKLAGVLAARIHDIEMEKEFDQSVDGESKMNDEFTIFINKLLIRQDRKEIIPELIQNLKCKILCSEQSRKFISFRRFNSTDTQADICSRYPCTLSKEDQDHLKRIKERRTVCHKDAVIGSPPLDSCSQTEQDGECWVPQKSCPGIKLKLPERPCAATPKRKDASCMTSKESPCHITPRVVVKQYIWESPETLKNLPEPPRIITHGVQTTPPISFTDVGTSQDHHQADLSQFVSFREQGPVVNDTEQNTSFGPGDSSSQPAGPRPYSITATRYPPPKDLNPFPSFREHEPGPTDQTCSFGPSCSSYAPIGSMPTPCSASIAPNRPRQPWSPSHDQEPFNIGPCFEDEDGMSVEECPHAGPRCYRRSPSPPDPDDTPFPRKIMRRPVARIGMRPQMSPNDSSDPCWRHRGRRSDPPYREKNNDNTCNCKERVLIHCNNNKFIDMCQSCGRDCPHPSKMYFK